MEFAGSAFTGKQLVVARLKLNCSCKGQSDYPVPNWDGVTASSRKGQLLLKGKAEILGKFFRSRIQLYPQLKIGTLHSLASSKLFKMAEAFLKEINPDFNYFSCTHQRPYSQWPSDMRACQNLTFDYLLRLSLWDKFFPKKDAVSERQYDLGI